MFINSANFDFSTLIQDLTQDLKKILQRLHSRLAKSWRRLYRSRASCDNFWQILGLEKRRDHYWIVSLRLKHSSAHVKMPKVYNARSQKAGSFYLARSWLPLAFVILKRARFVVFFVLWDQFWIVSIWFLLGDIYLFCILFNLI